MDIAITPDYDRCRNMAWMVMAINPDYDRFHLKWPCLTSMSAATEGTEGASRTAGSATGSAAEGAAAQASKGAEAQGGHEHHIYIYTYIYNIYRGIVL
jgi:hypothetical protein